MCSLSVPQGFSGGDHLGLVWVCSPVCRVLVCPRATWSWLLFDGLTISIGGDGFPEWFPFLQQATWEIPPPPTLLANTKHGFPNLCEILLAETNHLTQPRIRWDGEESTQGCQRSGREFGGPCTASCSRWASTRRPTCVSLCLTSLWSS